MFLDPRTKDKVILVAAKGDERLPAEVSNYVSPHDIPVAVGGKDKKSPLPNMRSTLVRHIIPSKEESSSTFVMHIS